jgi:hypothetical protein
LNAQLIHDVTITIQTTQGNWNNAFPKTDKVSQVIQAVIAHFGFAANGKYELTFKEKTLNAERTLVSYGIDTGDLLTFTELGTAV